MKYWFKGIIICTICVLLFVRCRNDSGNQKMVDLLAATAKKNANYQNSFSAESKLAYYESTSGSGDPVTAELTKLNIGAAYLELGEEQKAIDIWEKVLKRMGPADGGRQKVLLKYLAVAYLRLGERTNCIVDHTAQSCIFPVKAGGVHRNKSGSQKAIELYQQLLAQNPGDLESRWLLNIAYMTTGGYPQDVPADYLIAGLDKDTTNLVKPFVDMAHNLGIAVDNMAGGSIVDDFNNDGYLDIITSGWGLTDRMHYFKSKGDGSFAEASQSSHLAELTGGLNIQQTDYNNDGWLDILVLRGGWKGAWGKEPNSLIRNNGDGTFTDVTHKSGILSFHPTQTATWADFNNDGWLDVFIGNETSESTALHPCELYINNGDETFTESAVSAACNVIDFVKGVTSGDYNNDGYADIFISTLSGKKILLRNDGLKNGKLHFTDMSREAGFASNSTRTFPTWFWDYNNDGWMDILICSYEFGRALSYYSASEALGIPVWNEGKIFLYKNKHDGTFEDISAQAGLNKIVFAMGSNFGDIDNDGFLDMYLGTGNPLYQSLIPNKMFKNIGGERFADVTSGARVGNLQKGHAVSFADLDNDGDQDIHTDMGGAYTGDTYQSSLYINPGQNNNNRITVRLIGTTANKSAIGAKLKVYFQDNGNARIVYREVNSGGSFGSNPLMQYIGIGQAASVDSIQIQWPGSGNSQTVSSIPAGGNVRITEGKPGFTTQTLRSFDWLALKDRVISCAPE